ncbi:restriction endonuclease [Runella aurantiaca]|uniref:Restriction endonuclease n=1 Tax=Runella aurantiaca TaxID=2282308 RepID=A0A369IJF1_9BACT|nr:restriction endonuclease [Runella aurantiaca]RDB07394.1 restriction endonuclease [Runella aurantiaca]
MARSFTRVLVSAARAGARASRRYEAAQRREASARARHQKQLEREYVKFEKENAKRAKQEYLELRIEEALELTNEDNEKFFYLNSGIINETLRIDDTINFETLKPKYKAPSEEIPEGMLVFPNEPEEETFINSVGKMPIWGYLFKSSKQIWIDKIEEAESNFKAAYEKWKSEVSKRKNEIELYKRELQEIKKKYDLDFQRKCQDVDDFKASYLSGDEESVSAYVSIVLENSDYLFDWDRDFKLAYNKDAGELLIEFKLPNIDIIPNVLEYKYIKTKDVIEEKFRKKADIDNCYKNLVTSLAIRTIHEVIEADQGGFISVVIFNGFVETIDKANGKTIFPILLSISVSKDEFANINLSRVEPIQCIQSLSAKISPSLSGLFPVKPIKEFSMVDKRYVTEQDIVSSLSNRPNLMDLNPFEFENLVTNLFSKMGLETKQTRSSKDGGIDAVAFDLRPVLGGKIVIQAKRYKNLVGVSAVRDLYGTMINEGATKGILVSTSWYGADAYTFSKDKPIELIDGSGLLYLLAQIGVEAEIIMPDPI